MDVAVDGVGLVVAVVIAAVLGRAAAVAVFSAAGRAGRAPAPNRERDTS
ncbi:MAG: hypothetical protein KGJ98_01220 [Chloroflexota bacterium]|nr:hypothetical protein [Chloroflexota bacterium]MDE3100835.1 hypothetical protein [Chloroflexota bacterium]